MTLQEISEFLRSLWGLWLMALFLGIIFWTFRPRNKAKMDDAAMIPFRDDDDKER